MALVAVAERTNYTPRELLTMGTEEYAVTAQMVDELNRREEREMDNA